MEKKRCQVCDGPVVNGRCKLCGMPYRNDETLYHLNENRSDHYRHATSRARAIMRQEEIPLGDKKAGSAAYKTAAPVGIIARASLPLKMVSIISPCPSRKESYPK